MHVINRRLDGVFEMISKDHAVDFISKLLGEMSEIAELGVQLVRSHPARLCFFPGGECSDGSGLVLG